MESASLTRLRGQQSGTLKKIMKRVSEFSPSSKGPEPTPRRESIEGLLQGMPSIRSHIATSVCNEIPFWFLMVAHAHEKSFQARRHNFLDLCSKIRTATRKQHRRRQIDRRSKSYFSPFLLPALHLVEPNSPPASPDRLLPRVTARKFRFLIRFARPLARNGQVSPDERRAEER